MGEVKINKIVLQIGNKEIGLTVVEAKKLKGLLDEMYGSVIVERHDHWNWRPYQPHWATFTYSDTGNAKLGCDFGTVMCSDAGKLTMSV